MTGTPDDVESLRVRLARLQIQGRIEAELTAIARARQERGRLAGRDDEAEGAGASLRGGAAMPPTRATPTAGTTLPQATTGGRVPTPSPVARAVTGAAPYDRPGIPDANGTPPTERADGDAARAPRARLVGIVSEGTRAVDGAATGAVALLDLGHQVVAVPANTRIGDVSVARITREGALIDGQWQPLVQRAGRLIAPARGDEPVRSGLPAHAGGAAATVAAGAALPGTVALWPAGSGTPAPVRP